MGGRQMKGRERGRWRQEEEGRERWRGREDSEKIIMPILQKAPQQQD